MKFTRVWAMPASDTFDCKPIGDFVRGYLHGVSVDPFSRNKRWATHTNDLHPQTDAEYHMDAEEFLHMLARQGVKADCIILDPPYSPRQMSECYNAAGVKTPGKGDTQNGALYARVRRAAKLLCGPGTKVLSFGWNSCGMGRGFKPLEMLLVAHGGAHNDTICLAEECVQGGFLFGSESFYCASAGNPCATQCADCRHDETRRQVAYEHAGVR